MGENDVSKMNEGTNRSSRVRSWITVAAAVFLFASGRSEAAPKANLWSRWQEHNPASERKTDHNSWNAFLKMYVVASHPSGINRLRYTEVAPEHRDALRGYLAALQRTPVSTFNRAEQLAYWINLYNALTVDVILSRYPVRSIRDINISPGLFSRGPWGAKLLNIEGEKVSLDDIEHRILRPIWRDNRIHYAVNCASLGCPNLQPAAYTAKNAELLLEKGAREYINHPRGVTLKGGKLQVSSIYVWFEEDFAAGTQGVIKHLRKYAGETLARGLAGYNGRLEHEYDWRLNDAEQE